MRVDSSPRKQVFSRRSARRGATLLASAALLATLASSPAASAQTLTYGPILGRGLTPDQTIVRWGTSAATDLTTVAYRIKGTPTWQMQTAGPARDHEVILTGLTTGQTYEYEVRSLATPDGSSFTTCPAAGLPMDFVFYGDSRTGFGTVAGEHAKVLMQVARKAPEMIFESGDIVPNGTYAQYLSEFFPVAQDLVKSTPFMAAPGNHDYLSALATNYGLVFPSPRPAGAPWQSYYSFTCGNALFLSLNSNTTGDAAQLKFLTDQLAAARDDATIDHVFVWLHHAPYSVGTHGDNLPVQMAWVPILNQPEYKVTAVFAGHDHVYARMADASGVFYIVSGGAGANLYTDTGTSKATKVVSKSAFNFVTIHLAGKSMSAVAYDDTGTELDRFALNKGGPTPDGGAGDGGVSDGGVSDGSTGDGSVSDGSLADSGPIDPTGGDHDGSVSSDAAGAAPDLSLPLPPPNGGCSCSTVGSGSASGARGLGTLLLLGCALFAHRRSARRRAAAA